MDLMCNFLPGDPRLVEQIVKELKSQGIFDQFRKECISDVDTKPAYQNLRQRVEGSVTSFLNEQTWSPDMNKNQVREMLRKHIHESGFLETGVERIVDQVVNPKINTVFIPKVDDVMYKFLGIERPKEKSSAPLEINTVHDLLPNDLEAVSPELPEEKDFPKEEVKEIKVEEMSPSLDNNDKIMQEENSIDSQSSILSAVVSHDSNHSLRQDSVMSLNSSESRMSLPENTLKLELEDICLSQKSSDSNSKTEILSDEKNSENNIENKEEITNAAETFSEKSSEETKYKSKDGRRDKHHSSSDRSKSRNDKERDKSRSDKPKTEEKDGKTEEKKYKIPKLTDKNKDSKSKDKEEKSKSDKGKSDRDHRSDRDKKYDKDRKSKHSSEKDSSSNDRKKKDKNEKKDKDDKRDKKESSRSDKSRDDKRSSSSKKRDSQSSKDSQKEKDKESHTKSSKEETSDKNKKVHSSSSSRKDSKSRKDDDKYKSSHKKDEKNEKDERKRKRRSKDDHQSSKEKRNGGRSSDRDSDGPSSSKRPHVSPQTSNGDYSTQQTSQDSSTLNSEGSSGYSGNSDKAEDQHEEATNKAFIEMQKIKVPKFASNLNEAMKIMKIRKLLKKLDGVMKADPKTSEVQYIMGEIDDLTKDLKREKEEQVEHGEENEETDENQKAQASKSTPVNIDEFISSSNISMAKWNALEAKFMEQITDVDYNSYESPYMDEEEASFEIKDEKTSLLSEVPDCVEPEKSLIDEMAEAEEKASNENLDELEENLYSNINSNVNEDCNEKEEDMNIGPQDQNTPNHSNVTAYVSEQPAISKSTNSQAINVEEVESKDVGIDDRNPRNFKDFKQRAIVLLRKHALTEEMIKNKENSGCEADPVIETTSEEVNMKDDIRKDELEEEENSELLENSGKNDDEVLDALDKEETISREHTENNLVVEETISQDIDIYSLQNSCEVCLDSKGDLCKGLERSNNNRSLNFIQCIINILENEISRVKESNLEFYSKKQENYDYQTRKRKVIEWKTDVSNNNFENSASKRLEVEDTKTNPKKLLPTTKKSHPCTNTKTTPKLGHVEKEHLKVMNQSIRSPEMKSGKQSGVNCNAPERVENQVNAKTNRSADKSSEKKIRASQRYSSEDLYKPRIYLRRSGRDLKNP